MKMKPWDKLTDIEKQPYWEKATQVLDDLYYCDRVRGSSIMSQEDFHPADEDDDTVEDGAVIIYNTVMGAVNKPNWYTC